MKKSAIRRDDDVRANQISSLLSEKVQLKEKPEVAAAKINLSEVGGKIAVDLDDTVGDFMMDMRLALARRDGLSYESALERYPDTAENGISSWWDNDPDPDGRSYKEFLDVEKKGLLYKDQPVRKDAADVINWLHEETDGRVTFLTARPAAFNEVSKRWLRERVGIQFAIEIDNSNAKEHVEDFEIIIDDSVAHVKAISDPKAPLGPRKTVFMTRDRTHKAVESNDTIHHAWSWSDVKKIFIGKNS